MSVIRDSAGFTFTPFIWCGRQLGWTIWTPAGSCLRVVYDNNLEEAQRQAAAWATVNYRLPFRR